MIYTLLKIWARVALKIYCRHIFMEGRPLFKGQGPLLFAANHPNSFLDAVLIAANTKRKTYILVRGDVFSNKWVNSFLRYFGCIPVYRARDGKTLLGQNTLTFQECMAVFREGNNVLIFSEGICENEWNLRPLGKGTARLAFMGWESSQARNLKVIPTGFTYSHFNGIGKNVFLLAGHPIHPFNNFNEPDDPKKLTVFNHLLHDQLNELIIQFSGNEDQMETGQRIIENPPFRPGNFDKRQLMELQQTILSAIQKNERVSRKNNVNSKKLLVLPFALAGWLLYAPLYYPVNHLAKSKTTGTVYYDSVLFGLLFFLYPLYIFLVAMLLVLVTKIYWYGLFIIAAPILAYCTIQSGFGKRA